MDVPVNYLAVAIATVAAMIVGWLWYGPVFGKPWRRLSGLDTKKQPSPAVIYPITLVATFVSAYVLSYVTSLTFLHFGTDLVLRAVLTAVFLWLGWSAARALIVTLFEARPVKLFLINTGHNLVVALVMAVIIGVMGF